MTDTSERTRRIEATAQKIEFSDITKIDEKDALQVLAIRNEAPIRNNMYTNHEISRDEHFNWIDRLRGREDIKFFAVRFDGEIVGGVSLSGINTVHKRADWAFYLSETTHGRGIGAALEYKVVSLAFDQFKIEKLNCEVISFNDRVVKLHEKFGFRIEGVRREHVIRDGQKFDAILLGITKQEWTAR
ncbi:UDP-4-amino-4,6-dideoxy-N-acetyl-beta-L-altrosamine N-acetyltransferase [Nitratireductor soli]|uniref:UDP-4-amino-4, 6-dideoxy-N-acetyl-beta-L-altrosamine N-acetyltransferase n=1 Tax=Nitratireductor soli TaxID=1670619 RepID=UPI000A63C2C1|nr:UDP-4-amino-4,6-dideoxy-N-acetyl-beta-L-altrosamine N-acetyltransferase [Nitratireductor soli]